MRWQRRTYRGPADLDGAWLVHAATGDLAVDVAVARDAEVQQRFCVVASAAGPVRARTGEVQVAVHGGGDPGRAVAVRDAVSDLLDSGAADLASRRPLRVIA